MNTLSRRRALQGFGTAALALPAFASLPSLAFAQSSPDEYAMRTLAGGHVSMMASQLALEKSSNELVTNFANLEIDEVEAVKAVLTSTGVTPPSEIDSEERKALMEKLQSLDGGDFDAAYLGGQVEVHQQLLAIQEPMAEMSEITIPVATAKIARASILSHLSVLEGIQRTL